MSHIPPQYPLLGKEPTYNTKLADPTAKIADCWLEDATYTPLSLGECLTESQLKESRKRYRAEAQPQAQISSAMHGHDEVDLHVGPTDSGDDMIMTDCESSPDQHVHPCKRRLTVSAAGEPTNNASASSATAVNGATSPGANPLVASTLVAPVTASGMVVASLADREPKDAIHPCTPTLVESPNSPISELEDQNSHQLVLPSPSASPVQSAADKPSAQTALERQLAHVPTNQAELINMIVNLSGFVSAPNKNHLIFSLLQHVGRSSLSTFCDVIQNSLSHDLLTSLPLELALNVLSLLDARSLLSISQVSRRWYNLVSNTELWCYLLRRDNLMTSREAIERELADPEKLYAEWATPSPYLKEINYAQLLYKKRYLIFKRWMDPNYEPKRISISGHGSNIVTCLQHDEDKVITGIEGKSINVHSTKTGGLSRLLQGHDGGVWALKYFSNTLVSGSTDRDVRIWNIRTGRCTHVFRGHTSTVRCLDILHPVQIGLNDNGEPIIFPEVPLLVTGSRDHNLHVWKLPLDNERPGGDLISETKTFDSKDPNNPYLVCILSGHTQSVRSVTGYGNIVISGSYDTTVRVWDLRKGGRCKHVLEGHSDKIYSTALNFKSRRCYSGSMDSSINVWDFEKGKLLYSLEGHNLLVGLLELSEKYLVSAAADSTLRVWDPNTGENLSKLKGHNSAITCFQHDGLRIVSGSERMLKLWDIKTGKFVRDLLSDITGSIWQVSFDADRCVAAVQTSRNETEETYIEILDFSTPLNDNSGTIKEISDK
ncbi:hypothetical protein JCM33374_g2164 [Metschnikowia sp. JCM 33374]|nr:hypothetical protein JCM33374_g2164 [Metschnikowia sp. JCM 33374]